MNRRKRNSICFIPLSDKAGFRGFLIFLLTAIFLFPGFKSPAQSSPENPVEHAFNRLGSRPEIIRFTNNLKVNNRGGHLQGVQFYRESDTGYWFLSGSSDREAYLAIVKKGENNKVISVKNLMEKPFKHAGGFQIYQNYLAIGIEDNEAKDKSKVCIYDISDPENFSAKPVSVIGRHGDAFRSTAGCVGIAGYKNKILLAVGDWDTKNIDFYTCDSADFPGSGFSLQCSVNTESIDKNNWIDKEWISCQNINLYVSETEELFLVGLGLNSKNEHVAGLYRLTDNNDSFDLTKVASKSFGCENNVSFRAGAGIVPNPDGSFGIVSCGNHLEENSLLNYFGPTKGITVLPAHAHNDYEHKRPFYDALSCNFKSFEADVFSVGDSLFVAHDFEDIKAGRTLRKLYLDPLKKEIEKNGGSVYGNGEEVILLIDIKDEATRTYRLLHQILSEYEGLLTTFENGKKKKGNVLVVVSGNRPFDYMKSQNLRYAGFDGRLENLDSGISPGLMPVVSDNWSNVFQWDGTGEMSPDDKLILGNIAGKAINQGYILRFWNTPNRTPEQRKSVWKELKNAGVGLIGADELKELEEFFRLNL